MKEHTAENILPCDGTAHYFPKVFDQARAGDIFDRLLETITWKADEVIIFGKKITTKRATAWYGDEPFLYTYSHTTKTALPWTAVLLELKQAAENLTGAAYNACLLNLYHTRAEAMGWHSDDEKSIVKNSSIASFSFGAERRFSFRHKRSKESVSLWLENGSLLEMRNETQQHWLHALPASKKIPGPRINLTFRRMAL